MRRVGKHSARGSQEGRDRRSVAAGSGQGHGPGPEFVEHIAPGAPPMADEDGPGTGRRRRGVPGPGAPDPGVTPPQGVPRLPYGAGGPAARTRGGHPEQREAGGGWGAVGGRGAGPGGPRGPVGPGGPGGPRPPYGMRTMNPPQRPTTGGTGGAAGLMPGPRKEYIEAFDTFDALDCDGDDVFAAGAPGGVPPQRRTRTAAAPSGGIGGGSGGDGGGGPDDDGSEPSGKGARGAAKGGKGRTFTGVAAAAVTTVLAVVVAGQVASGPQSGGKTQSRGGSESGGDTASRADDGRAPARPAGSPAPVTYDAKMAALYPLDAKLRGSGAFRTVGGHDKAPGRGQLLRYRVDVERDLPLDGELFAEAVHKTLNDDRSWGHGGVRTFERVSSGHADFVITLASPGTTATWCAKSGLDTTEDNVSCDSASTERVMINAYRWAQGAKTFGDDKMHSYRQMLINHEVGHRLGHNHEICSQQGALAPVMMQQTKFLSTDGATCRPNAWPFPKG
ncbi:DUF3152 domain-containing protein [Streptomyces samsunensis]|uniref:DUF3152 domain-containing protein n=1 Tax=Streptomyces autolyticus TaxID=75293 RepID=A0ABN4W9H7_9ACTN|nr:DUF3152 domain-containing protein [Streptomyces samsunensis]AQA13919.1 hypothetical protein BV401_29445 [Streptomyces autolyticus]NUH41110.1 DUF3152 domain-containing protein [Streptomyces samsunensis]